jgi:hypothetical protein
MVATDKVFAGSIPEIYDRYLVPLIFDSYALDLAERVAITEPQDVLETAAGSGVLTRAIASTVASGRCTWLPMPVEIAAGKRPMQADSAIIMIGRICCSTALAMASIAFIPVVAI